MRIFFSVGEPSGDLHGSNLIRRLKSQDPTIECVGFGGPKMAAAGCQIHYDLTSMAVMFIAAAIKNLRFFFRLIDQANDYFEQQPVDAVVLIDYPGFNWWIARKAKKHGIPVFYYGVPQMWAFNPWRVRKLRRLVDHSLCKLPFEVEWFAKRNCHATYVGHPYFDQLEQQAYDESFMAEFAGDPRKLLTLLPGSRDLEVKNVLPILLNAACKTAEQVDQCRVAIACFNERQKAMADEMLRQQGLSFETFVGKTPELMKLAHCCVACSGSVSMELLHHRKPTVIVYKIKRLFMVAFAFLFQTQFITLVNLIAAKDIRKKTWGPYDPDSSQSDAAVMPEYLTTGDPSKKVARWLTRWLTDDRAHRDCVAELDALASRYALPGATNRAADYILKQTRLDLKKKSAGQTLDVNISSGPTNRREDGRSAA
jgi:lipid-A-disaccharide synthase